MCVFIVALTQLANSIYIINEMITILSYTKTVINKAFFIHIFIQHYLFIYVAS